MGEGLKKRIDTLSQWLYESGYLVVFTGAGISTKSGLPDFKGPDGLWTRRDKGLVPQPMVRSWDSVEPNKGHRALFIYALKNTLVPLFFSEFIRHVLKKITGRFA